MVLRISVDSSETVSRQVRSTRDCYEGICRAPIKPAQLEMVDDQYPIVLINGQDLIKELYEIAGKDHGGDLKACVEGLLSSRSLEVLSRRPAEILLD